MSALEIVSLIVALASVGSSIFSSIMSVRDRIKKLADARKVSLEQVIASNDIRQLGVFLDKTVGQFDVSEYVDSKDVTETIDRYFDGVINFLGTSESANEEERVREVDIDHPRRLPDQKDVTELMKPIVSELEHGEIWNALASLRRLLEIRLRERALKIGFKERHLGSAGQILHILAERDYLAPDVATSLRYAIAVCNRAIHGREVSLNEAEEAFWIVERALMEIST